METFVKENVLDILIYLFEHYMLEHVEDEMDENVIMQELVQAGFSHTTIDRAFDWLENLAIMCDEHETSTLIADQQGDDVATSVVPISMRHFAPDELDRISFEARGLLLSLEQRGLLTAVSREMVIDRLMALDDDEIELEHVKWVILMVLTNCSDDFSTEWTEALVLDGSVERTH